MSLSRSALISPSIIWGERAMQRHDIGLPQQFFQTYRFRRDRIVRDDLHAECLTAMSPACRPIRP